MIIMMNENIFATSLTSMHWLFPQHLDSKQTLGFEASLEISGCRDDVACPGNQIQTCGCMENQDLYPMVVASSQLGNQYFHFLYENNNRKIIKSKLNNTLPNKNHIFSRYFVLRV